MLFERWRSGRSGGLRRGADGYRLYAIGDVHGRLDLLRNLLRRIERDHQERGGDAAPVLVFLGDLIDRGPHSREVVDLAARGALPGFQSVVLAGNHEEVLLRLLEGEEGLLPQWLAFGGAECLQSYGLDPLALSAMPEPEAVETIASAIPAEHLRFLRSLGDTFTFGDYLFVHAGIRPGIPLEKQSPADLRWIRQPFLGDRRDHGMMVVHGHTISEAVEQRPNRIGIDTGAYKFGLLTAIAVEGEERWYLSEDGSGPAGPTDGTHEAGRQPGTA